MDRTRVPAGAGEIKLQAGMPPVGFVESKMRPLLSTPAQNVGLEHDMETIQ
jgi:hypothetical protein